MTSGQVADCYRLVEDFITSNKVMIFSDSTCSDNEKIKSLFEQLDEEYCLLELDVLENGSEMRTAVAAIAGDDALPQIFVNKNHSGGYDITMQYHEIGDLWATLHLYDEIFEYSVIVIGGGFEALAAAKVTNRLKTYVAIVDSVIPALEGNICDFQETWVKDDSISKNLMLYSAILGEAIKNTKVFGWNNSDDAMEHNWSTMRENIQKNIGKLNWEYRSSVWNENVHHINAYAQFVDSNIIKIRDKKGKEYLIKGEKIVIATGDRPRYPSIDGAREYCITSDDLFSLEHCPGKTLIVGGSVVALECAGILASLRLDVTVMVRSEFLRGFDIEIAELLAGHMKSMGIRFLWLCAPTKIEKDGETNKLKVTALKEEEEIVDEYETVVFAIGREACTDKLGLDKAGVEFNPENGKIPVKDEQTNVPHIYAIGDVVEGRHHNPAVSIKAGELLAYRICDTSTTKFDYLTSPFIIFTPVEYGCIGYTEEAAIETFGVENITVYYSCFASIESKLFEPEEDNYLAKIISLVPENEKIIGLHYVGPNATEVVQGFALAMKKGATKQDLDAISGSFLSCSGVFINLNKTRFSKVKKCDNGV